MYNMESEGFIYCKELAYAVMEAEESREPLYDRSMRVHSEESTVKLILDSKH